MTNIWIFKDCHQRVSAWVSTCVHWWKHDFHPAQARKKGLISTDDAYDDSNKGSESESSHGEDSDSSSGSSDVEGVDIDAGTHPASSSALVGEPAQPARAPAAAAAPATAAAEPAPGEQPEEVALLSVGLSDSGVSLSWPNACWNFFQRRQSNNMCCHLISWVSSDPW